jgi:hypothetical protein
MDRLHGHAPLGLGPERRPEHPGRAAVDRLQLLDLLVDLAAVAEEAHEHRLAGDVRAQLAADPPLVARQRHSALTVAVGLLDLQPEGALHWHGHWHRGGCRDRGRGGRNLRRGGGRQQRRG